MAGKSALSSNLGRWLVFSAILIAGNLFAYQAGISNTAPGPDRLFAFYQSATIGKANLLLSIDYRSVEYAFQDPLFDAFGLDTSNYKLGFGFRYGVLENMDLGFRRTNNALDRFDTYEFDARYQFQREERIGIDLSVLTGFTWFAVPDSDDASGFYLQLLAGKTFASSIYLSTGLMTHTSSTYYNKDYDTTADYSVALPIGIHWAAGRTVGVIAEGALPLVGYSAGVPSWAIGFKLERTAGTFAVFLTNTQYFTTDGFVSGSDRMGAPVLGFLGTLNFLHP